MVKVAAAKGRPMLSWVGKRPLREVRAFPAQLVERFNADGSTSHEIDWSDWPDRYERGGTRRWPSLTIAPRPEATNLAIHRSRALCGRFCR